MHINGGMMRQLSFLLLGLSHKRATNGFRLVGFLCECVCVRTCVSVHVCVRVTVRVCIFVSISMTANNICT